MRILLAISLVVSFGFCQTPNRVFDLDGASQYAITVIIGGFNSSTISAEAWIRPEAPVPGTGPRQTRIVNKGTEGTQGLPDGRFSLTYTEDGTPGAVSGIVTWTVYLGSFIPNDQAVVVSPTPIPTDQWTHVAGTFSSVNGVAQLYVNGNQVASTMMTQGGMPISGTTMTSTPQPAAIGAIPSNSMATVASTAFRGQIDEVRVWSVERTAIQMASEFVLELSTGTGLVDAWHFNGNSQGTFNMSSAQGGPRYPISFVPGFGGGAFPYQAECQVNQPEATIDVDGMVGDASGPAFSSALMGTVNLGSTLVGSFWDLAFTAPEFAVPLAGAGVGLFDGQTVNLDIGAASFSSLTGFASPFPGALSFPFNVPLGSAPVSAQMVITDPSAGTGMRLSGPLVLGPGL